MGMLESIAYLFGNIEPDICIFSYFSGTEPGDEGRGHNYKTAMTRIRKLEMSLVPDGIAAAYKLGKITHYAADIFTHPHNPELFHGTLREHMAYERKLDTAFESFLKSGAEVSSSDSLCIVSEDLERLHEKYEKLRVSVRNDILHIMLAATMLRTGFSYESGFLARRAFGR